MCRKISTPSDPKPASTSTAGACCLKLGLARRNVHLHVGIRWHLFTQVVRTRGGLGEWESGEKKNASLCSLTFKKVVILVFSVRHCFSFLTLTFFFCCWRICSKVEQTSSGTLFAHFERRHRAVPNYSPDQKTAIFLGIFFPPSHNDVETENTEWAVRIPWKADKRQ